MIGSVHGSNLWQTTYSFSPSSASIMSSFGASALEQDAGRAMAGRRADSCGRVQDGDGRLSSEQRQTCEGDGGEPSFGRLFVGLLVSCAGKILLALNGGKNNAGFRNDCFRNLRFVNRYAGFCASVNDNIVLNTLIVNALCPSLNSKPLFPKRRFRK